MAMKSPFDTPRENRSRSLSSLFRPSLLLSTFAVVTTSFFSTSSHAQSTSSILITREPAYATTADGRAFYVHGGRTTLGPTNQLLSLDLTQGNWSSTQPLFVQKPLNSVSGGKSGASWADYWHTASFTKDQTELVIWSTISPTITKYNILTGTWSAPIPRPVGLDLDGIPSALSAVTDPLTGLIYLPSGAMGNRMAVYDPERNWGETVGMPVELAPGTRRYSAAWNSVRGRLVLFGGSGSMPNGDLYEFEPQTKSWSKVVPQGDAPHHADYPCLVPAQNGTTLMLFGGSTAIAPGGNLATIHILDAATNTWRKGTDADPIQKRSRMACTASGDNFLAWGGGNQNPLIIYNIRDDKWTTRYTPGMQPPLTNPGAGTGGNVGISSAGGSGGHTGGGTTTPGSSTMAIGAVVGGIAGGILLVVLVAWVCYRNGRRQQNKTVQMVASLCPGDDGGGGGQARYLPTAVEKPEAGAKISQVHRSSTRKTIRHPVSVKQEDDLKTSSDVEDEKDVIKMLLLEEDASQSRRLSNVRTPSTLTKWKSVPSTTSVPVAAVMIQPPPSLQTRKSYSMLIPVSSTSFPTVLSSAAGMSSSSSSTKMTTVLSSPRESLPIVAKNPSRDVITPDILNAAVMVASAVALSKQQKKKKEEDTNTGESLIETNHRHQQHQHQDPSRRQHRSRPYHDGETFVDPGTQNHHWISKNPQLPPLPVKVRREGEEEEEGRQGLGSCSSSLGMTTVSYLAPQEVGSSQQRLARSKQAGSLKQGSTTLRLN